LRSCAGLGITFEGTKRNASDSWHWNATLWERNAFA